MRKVYLDYSATTPVDKRVMAAMRPYFTESYGNPSSLYRMGQKARRAVDTAREQVAEAFGTEPETIIFTSGGSEADNQAIKSTAFARREEGHHIITTKIEHHAVLHTCEYLEKYHGFEITYLPVDEDGLVSPTDLEEALREDTILVTIMYANNEIGTIQPIPELGEVVEDHQAYFHTDAVQAAGALDIDLSKLPVDMMSVSAHKLYGPKGTGALYVKKGIRIPPLLHGGAQERKMRAGTENVAGIVGFGAAVELAQDNLKEERERLCGLRDYLIERITSEIDEVVVNGHPEHRLPNNVNICFKYIEGESLLLNLDMVGIAASSGSACTSGSLEPSHVLLALGLPPGIAQGSLRLSLGRETTQDDLDYMLEKLKEIVSRLRSMSPLYEGESGAD